MKITSTCNYMKTICINSSLHLTCGTPINSSFVENTAIGQLTELIGQKEHIVIHREMTNLNHISPDRKEKTSLTLFCSLWFTKYHPLFHLLLCKTGWLQSAISAKTAGYTFCLSVTPTNPFNPKIITTNDILQTTCTFKKKQTSTVVLLAYSGT